MPSREELIAALSMGPAPQQGTADPRWQRLMQALAFDPAQFGAGGQEMDLAQGVTDPNAPFQGGGASGTWQEPPSTLGEWWEQSTAFRPAAERAEVVTGTPMEVYRGELDPTSDEAIERMFDLAGMATLGAGAVPAKAAATELRTGARLPFRHNFRGEKGEYDSDFYDIEEDNLVTEAGEVVGTKDRLLPKRGEMDRIPAEKQEGIIYRGMSAAEYEEFLKTGELRSAGSYNIGPDQEGLTYYTTDPQSAQSYANSFAPSEHKPSFDKPAYVVAVRAPSPDKIKHVEGTGEHEVGVTSPISASDVVRVFRGDVVRYEPSISGRGYRQSASASLNWSDVTPAKERKGIR